jgi:hypothetical protein
MELKQLGSLQHINHQAKVLESEEDFILIIFILL